MATTVKSENDNLREVALKNPSLGPLSLECLPIHVHCIQFFVYGKYVSNPLLGRNTAA